MYFSFALNPFALDTRALTCRQAPTSSSSSSSSTSVHANLLEQISLAAEDCNLRSTHPRHSPAKSRMPGVTSLVLVPEKADAST